ncbi:MAG: hypothetical protein CVT85_02870 [Alphaproteobacteria bacterium HGW-Alphaproteobacteria-7]|nr:MAG: hypothetical protein CVT85_02870 [Alphaproteobacteria bacterium HGW-Alphaproteobacteria-7]
MAFMSSSDMPDMSWSACGSFEALGDGAGAGRTGVGGVSPLLDLAGATAGFRFGDGAAVEVVTGSSLTAELSTAAGVAVVAAAGVSIATSLAAL